MKSTLNNLHRLYLNSSGEFVMKTLLSSGVASPKKGGVRAATAIEESAWSLVPRCLSNMKWFVYFVIFGNPFYCRLFMYHFLLYSIAPRAHMLFLISLRVRNVKIDWLIYREIVKPKNYFLVDIVENTLSKFHIFSRCLPTPFLNHGPTSDFRLLRWRRRHEESKRIRRNNRKNQSRWRLENSIRFNIICHN